MPPTRAASSSQAKSAGSSAASNASSDVAPPSRRVIEHMKAEGHLGRCYLKGRAGDAANVILSAVGYNLRAWLRMILRAILLRYSRPSQFGSTNWIFNGRRTRTASFSCRLWPRQANDDS
jgi:hypothetical protein